MQPYSFPTVASGLTVSLLLGWLRLTSADAVVFVDQGGYLRKDAPASLSAPACESLLAVLARRDPPSDVSLEESEEIDKVLEPRAFDRPAAVWSVSVFGAAPSDMSFRKAGPLHTVSVAGDALAGARGSSFDVYRKCSFECLATSLGRGASKLGGSFERGPSGIDGRLRVDECSPAELQIGSPEMLVWASEMAALWKSLEDNSATADSPAHFSTSLTGLRGIRRRHGRSSDEYRSASCITGLTVEAVHESLSDLYGGRVVTAVIMEDAGGVEGEEDLDVALALHGRSLLQFVSRSLKDDPSKPVGEQVKRFSTNAVGYVMFLVLFFFSLGSLYAMTNMDFTKDTLLYAQVKLD